MRRCGVALLALLLAQLGCTVTAVTEGDDPRPNNSCQNDSECGAGTCRDGLCQTLNGQLEALLISATPPSDSAIPHLTFVAQLEDVPTSGGSQDLTLPGPSHVVGSLVLPKDATCYPTFISDDSKTPIGPADDGRTLPVTVTLSLRQRLLGLPQQLYFASTNTRNKQGGYTFDLQVPRGEYDVYLVPPPKQERCPVPPQLYRSFLIDRENYEITFPLSASAALPLTIRWPKASASLVGWTVDIIEPLGGNAISTALVLGNPTDLGMTSPSVEYPASLSYSTVIVPAAAAAVVEVAAASDLLRLRPRPDQIAPTIFLDRSALGLLLKPGQPVLLDRFTRVPDPVTVEGLVAREDDGTPIDGYVTLISTEIYGVDTGIFASYHTTLQIEAGTLRAELPPGKYRVQAVPALPDGPIVDGALAALETTWDIPADAPVQYGKLLELKPISAVVGQTRFLGAQVQAVPSPQTLLPFEEAFGAGPFPPARASSGLVDNAGKFTVLADPGRFDLSVQAPDSLGFGWFVRPGALVGEHNLDLGRVTLPTPSMLSGTARVALGGTEVALGFAAIRAYAYLDKDLAYTRDAKQAASVVQVAETRADEIGAFRLLVPSRIAASK